MNRPHIYIILLILVLFQLVTNIQAAEESLIAFLSNEKGDHNIFLINIDGEIVKRIETDAMRKVSLTLSPKSYYFAYTSNQFGNPDVFKMDVRNRKPIQLTQRAERNIWPAWSPNGKWIAFVSDRDGSQHIYRMKADGTNLLKLTNRGHNGKPAWSPDSKWIAFNSSMGRHAFLYVMNANGGQVEQVTGALPIYPGCDWSPDGKKITFSAGSLGKEAINIFTIDVTGNNQRQITFMPQNYRCLLPAWSPDGNWIAYSGTEVLEWPNPENQGQIRFSDSIIYIIDSKGEKKSIPLKETIGLAGIHESVWTTEAHFFSVSPDANKQTVIWGKLKNLR